MSVRMRADIVWQRFKTYARPLPHDFKVSWWQLCLTADYGCSHTSGVGGLQVMSFALLDLCDRIRSAQRVFNSTPELPPFVPFRQAAWDVLRTLIREELNYQTGQLWHLFGMLDLPRDQAFTSPDMPEQENPLLVWLWGDKEERDLLNQEQVPDPLKVDVAVTRILRDTTSLAFQLLRLQHARGLLSPEHAARVKSLP